MSDTIERGDSVSWVDEDGDRQFGYVITARKGWFLVSAGWQGSVSLRAGQVTKEEPAHQ